MLKFLPFIVLFFNQFIALSSIEIRSDENEIEIDFYLKNNSSSSSNHVIKIDYLNYHDSTFSKNIINDIIPNIRENETLIYTLNKNELYDIHRLSGLVTLRFMIDNHNFIRQFNLGIKKNELIINEILFNNSSDNSEFIELKNNSVFTHDLIGLKIQDRSFIDKNKFSQISRNLILKPGEYALISMGEESLNFYNLDKDQSKFFYNLSPKISLNNSDDVIRILNKSDILIDSIYYSEKMHSDYIYDQKNVSLERDLSTNKLYSCANILGASPLELNSITKTNSEYYLKSNKRIIKAQDEILKLEYKLPFPQAIINLSVYDEDGRIVKRVASSELSPSEGTFFWDGTNESRIFTQSGVYIIFLIASDLNTNQMYKRKLLVATVN